MVKYILIQIYEVEAQDCGSWRLYKEKNYGPENSNFTRLPGDKGYPHVC